MHGGDHATERIDTALDARHVRVAELNSHVPELPAQTIREASSHIVQRIRIDLHRR
jgi:hypothetical protein